MLACTAASLSTIYSMINFLFILLKRLPHVELTKFYLALHLILFSLIFSSVHAFERNDLKKLLDEKNCLMCDLSDADFSSKDLSGVECFMCDFSNAAFFDADLSNSKFVGADFTNANLENATITGTEFAGATLTNAIWIDGVKCDDISLGECNRKKQP